MRYSFCANALATVDLPTRRGPSIRAAVLPLSLRFHSSRYSYIFRVNIALQPDFRTFYFSDLPDFRTF